MRVDLINTLEGSFSDWNFVLRGIVKTPWNQIKVNTVCCLYTNDGGNHFVGTFIYLFIYLFIIVCCLRIKCQGNVNESSSPGGVYWWCGRWCLLSPWEQTSKSGRGFLEGEHPLWLLTFIGNTVMSKCWSTYHYASNFMGTQNLAKCKKRKHLIGTC